MEPDVRKKGSLIRQQIFVDVSVILHSDAQTGIQRVVRALMGAMLDADLPGWVVRPVFATRHTSYAYVPVNATLFADRSNLADMPQGPIAPKDGDIFLALDLAAHILPHHRRNIAAWQRAGCRIVTVLYDLLPERYPQWFNPKGARKFRRWLRVVTKLSDQIVCISKNVAHDLERWVGWRPWRGNKRLEVCSMRLGGDINGSTPTAGMPPGAEALLERFAQQPTILTVGTIEPRKGHACLLRAFDVLWSDADGQEIVLVFVGRPGWKTNDIQRIMREHPERQSRFFWFDDASDEFLTRLYLVARGVMVPSYAEGYGLPVVEALQHGVPVLARDLPVFREMRLANVSYFTQDEAPLLAASIKEWIASAAFSPSTSGAPTWSDAFGDLMRCLNVRQRINALNTDSGTA